MGNPLRIQKVPSIKDDAVRGYPRLRAFVDQVSSVLTSLLSRSQVVRTTVDGVDQWQLSQSIAPGGGLAYNGAGELTIKLASTATSILNLTTSGLGFGNQTGNTVLASPANGANGPPIFRSLNANDIPSLVGVYQPLDADLTAIAALSGTNTIYYRSAANTWSAVTIGGNLTFNTGTLNANLALVPPPPPLPPIVNSLNAISGNIILANGSGINLGNAGSTITVSANYSNIGGTGNFANLPPAAGGLPIYIPFDQPFTSASNGTAWFTVFTAQPPMVPASSATFTTTQNAGNFTITQYPGYVQWYSASDGGGVNRHLYLHSVTGNWTVSAATELVRHFDQGGTMCFGLCIRNSGSGHFLEWLRIQSDSQFRLLQQLFTDEFNFSGVAPKQGDALTGFWPNQIYWQRVTHNISTTTLTFEWSYDGVQWILWNAYVYDAFLSGFDQLGIVAQNAGSNGPSWANLWDYQYQALP